MRRNILISMLLLSVTGMLTAQDFDKQIISQTDIIGTARYVAMGGAFTAIGGDVSAAVDNPAAMGIFRRGEVSATGELFSDRVRSDGHYNINNAAARIPQVSWVLNFNRENIKQKGVINSSMLLQYHRIKNFNREASYGGSSAFSLTDLMADLTNGLNEAQLQDLYWAESKDVGTLSKMGYELYLIDPDATDPTRWHSILAPNEQVQTTMNVQETGYTDQYSFAWGANVSHVVYFGLGVNLQSLKYNKHTSCSEAFTAGDFVSSTDFSATGFGVNGSLGLIAHPVQMLRLGISYQTPTWMTLTTSSSASANSLINSIESNFSFEEDKFTDDKYILPMKLTLGAALQFNQMGMLSFEYDLVHQSKKQIADVHRLKLGAEVVLKNHYFLRAGYACQSSFKKDAYLNVAYDDLRADTDFKNIRFQHFISAGFGFRNSYIIAEMAYQCRVENSNVYAFSRPLYNGIDEQPEAYQNQIFGMNSTTHRIVLSLGWTLRK